MKTKVVLEKGTKYDKNAVRDLINAGWDETTATNLINSLFKTDIHAFVHSPSWLEKYLLGIARMYTEETDGSQEQIDDFKAKSTELFNQYLTWVKENREKLGGTEFDNKFNKSMSFQEMKDDLKRIQDEIDAKSKEELSKMKFDRSNFSIVPIKNYKQMHDLYGGHWTGDGSSDLYAGGGGTAWCHTNSEYTYDSWVSGNEQFFVLQNNDWKDIPFDKESNARDPKDDYGNSLIAIRTDEYGNLLNATLRCNHVGVRSSADNQYDNYADLSRIAGFNVEEEIKKNCKEFKETDAFVIEDGVIVKVKPEFRRNVSGVLKIPDGITGVGDSVFSNMSFTSIEFPEGFNYIGNLAFSECSELKRVSIPDTVTEIGEGAFHSCSSLEIVSLSRSITVIEAEMFHHCISLKEIVFPKGLTEIKAEAFRGCEKLEYVNLSGTMLTTLGKSVFSHSGIKVIALPDNIDTLPSFAFSYCENLDTLYLPKNVKVIGKYAFYGCTHLYDTSELQISSVSAIDKEAFRGCTALANITLPKTVTFVAKNVFKNCPNLEGVLAPYIDNYDEWGLPVDCEIEFYGRDSSVTILESYKRKKAFIEMKNEKDNKEVVYDSDEEPEEGHFADDKDDLDFEDDVDKDDILVEEEGTGNAKDLALATVELFDSDTMDWDTGVYDKSEDAIDNLAKLKVMSQMSEEDWTEMWENSNWSILQKFIEDHPANAEEIFNAVAEPFGFSNYKDYKTYQDWVANEEEEYVKAMQELSDEEDSYSERTIDSPYQTDDDYYGSSSYLSDDSESYDWNEEENIRNSSLLKDLYGDDWYEDEPEDLEEATNTGAIANVPATHKKIDLFTEEDDEEELDEE